MCNGAGNTAHCPDQRAQPARSVVQFKEVFLTPEYLAIAMEYAAGGDMFQYVKQRGGLEEAEARWFFQQLIIGMDYCHKMVRTQGPDAGSCSHICGAQKALSGMHERLAGDRLFIKCCWVFQYSQAFAAMLLVLRLSAPWLVGRGKSGYKAGKHAAGRQQAAAAEDLRLWLLQKR